MFLIRKLPKNVSQEPDGRLRARISVGGKRPVGRFAIDTETRRRGVLSDALRATIDQWMTDTRDELLATQQDYGAPPPAHRGPRRTARAGGETLDHDAPEFLRQIASRTSYAADRSHLRACQACEVQLEAHGPLVRVGTLRRDVITDAVVRLMIVAWQTAPSRHGVRRVRVSSYTRSGGVELPAYERAKPATSGTVVAAKTIRHRLRVLRELYTTLDGSQAPTPVTDVKLPTVITAPPIDVDEDTILAVAANLWRAWQPRTTVRVPRDPEAWATHERARQQDERRTWARFLVLVTTGQRPCQVMRAEKPDHGQPGDVNLQTRVWIVRAAKGGPAHPFPLTTPMVRAWEAFSAAEAWGTYDTTTHANRVHLAGWPHGVRPYNARHALMINALNERQVNLDDVQGLAGHASPVTTRTFYAPVAISRQRQVAAKLETRLAALFRPRRVK